MSAGARAIEWMFAALNTIEPLIMDLAMATVFEADQPWSKPRQPAVEKRVEERLGELSRRLADTPWLDGDTFTAGDLLMVSVLRIPVGKALVEKYANLSTYLARGTARPAFQKALADQLAGFTGKAPPGFAS